MAELTNDFPTQSTYEEFPPPLDIKSPAGDEARTGVTAMTAVAYGGTMAKAVDDDLRQSSTSPTLALAVKELDTDQRAINRAAAESVLLNDQMADQEKQALASFLLTEEEQSTAAGAVEQDAVTVLTMADKQVRQSNSQVRDQLGIASAEYVDTIEKNSNVMRNIITAAQPELLTLLLDNEEANESITLGEGVAAIGAGFTDAAMIIESLLPGSEHEVYLDVISEAFPELDVPVTSKLLSGQSLSVIKDALSALPPEELPTKVTQIIDIVDKNAGFLNSNELIRWTTISDMFNELALDTSGKADYAEIAGNIGSFLDYAPLVGSIAKLSLKATKVVAKSKTAGTMLSAAPENMGASLAESITDPALMKQLNDATGATADDVVELTLPNTPNSIITELPDTVRDALKTTKQDIDKVKNFLADPSNSNAVDNLAAQKANDIEAAITGIEGYHVGKSTVRTDLDGITVQAVYGNDAAKGFANQADALAAMTQRFPDADPSQFSMMYKSTSTGTVEDVLSDSSGIVAMAMRDILPKLKRKRIVNPLADGAVQLKAARVAATTELLSEVSARGANAISRGEFKSLLRERDVLKGQLDTAKKALVNTANDAPKIFRAKKASAQDMIARLNPVIRAADDRVKQQMKLKKYEEDADRIRAGKIPPEYNSSLDLITSELLRDANSVAADIVQPKDLSGALILRSEAPRPEYFVKVDQFYGADKTTTAMDDIVFGASPEFGNTNPSWIHQLTRAIGTNGHVLSNAVLTPESRFGAGAVGAITKALDMQKGTSKYLDKLAGRTFNKLNTDDRYKVAKLLTEGNRSSKTYTGKELSLLLPNNEKAATAYYEMREVYNGLYEILNEALSLKLHRAGYKQYAHKGTTYIGKPLDEGVDVGTVWNPATKTFDKMNAESTQKLIDDGQIIMRTDSKTVVGNQSSDYTILPTNGVRVDTVKNPVPYREGYVPNIYKDNYFVRAEKTFIHNGKAQTKDVAIATAPTLHEAKRLADRLGDLESYKGTKVFPDRSRELKSDTSDSISELTDMLGSSNGPSGRRGAKLPGAGDLDNLENPLTAISASINTVTKQAAMQPTLDKYQAKIFASYGKMLKINPKTGEPVKPRLPSDFIDNANITSKTKADAIEQQEYLDNIIAMKNGAIKNAYKEGLLKIAEGLSPIAPNLSRAVASGYNADPLKALTTPAFVLQLGLNVTAQWLVQGSQILFLTGITNPLRLFSDSSAMLIGRMAVNTGNKALLKTASKTMGITPKQMEEYIDAMKLSGILNIDSLSHSQDALNRLGKAWIDPNAGLAERITKTAISTATNVATAVPRAATRVGFEAAENLSISLHWTVAFRNWMKANGGKVPANGKEWADVAEETRRLSLNFTRTGEAAYQRGMLRPAMQYMSFQHKAMATVAPQVLGGSKAFTTREKASLMVGNLFMHGAMGIPFGAYMYDKYTEMYGETVPQPVRDVFDGILLDEVANMVFTEVSGEEQNLDISKRIAPLGGIQDASANIVAAVMTVDPISVFLGPSKSAWGKVADVTRDTLSIMQAPDIDTAEKSVEMLDTALRIAPQYSNYVKGMLYRNLQATVNKNMEHMDATTALESFAYGFFGVQSKEITDYYKLRNDVNGPYNPRTTNDEAGKIAEDYYRRWTQQATDVLSNPPETVAMARQNVLNEWANREQGLLSMLDEDLRIAVEKKLYDKFTVNNADPVIELITRVASKDVAGIGTDKLDGIIKRAALIGNWSPEMTTVLTNLYNDQIREEE